MLHSLRANDFHNQTAGAKGGPRHISQKSLNLLQNLFAGEKTQADVPLATMRGGNRRDSVVPHDAIDEETERHL